MLLSRRITTLLLAPVMCLLCMPAWAQQAGSGSLVDALDQARATTAPNDRHAERCRTLVNYRDGDLARQFEIVFNRNEAFNEGLQIVAEIRQELASDTTTWYGMSGTNEWAPTVARVAGFLKVKVNLIGNLIQFHPGAKAAITIGKQGVLSAQRVYAGLKAGGTAKRIVEGGLDEAYTEVLLAMSGPVGQAVTTARDLAEDIEQIVYAEEQQQELLSAVQSVTANLDHQLRELQQKVQAERHRIHYINQVKEGIDRYCGELPETLLVEGDGGEADASARELADLLGGVQPEEPLPVAQEDEDPYAGLGEALQQRQESMQAQREHETRLQQQEWQRQQALIRQQQLAAQQAAAQRAAQQRASEYTYTREDIEEAEWWCYEMDDCDELDRITGRDNWNGGNASQGTGVDWMKFSAEMLKALGTARQPSLPPARAGKQGQPFDDSRPGAGQKDCSLPCMCPPPGSTASC